MGLFSRGPNPTIRTGYRKTDQHLDQVFAELQAAAAAGHRTHAISIGWNEAIRNPASTVPLYIDQLQRAGYGVESVDTPSGAPATVIVGLTGIDPPQAAADGPTSMGMELSIKMIAAFDNGWLYAVNEDGAWKSRYIFSDETPDMDLRQYSSFRELCLAEGHEHAQTMGSVGIVPTEMQEDFAAAFHGAR